MPDTRIVNNVPVELLERALSATIAARGPGSPTERDLRQLIDSSPSTEDRQFFTDVLTAAGMIRYGRQDKKFAQRLSDELSRFTG